MIKYDYWNIHLYFDEWTPANLLNGHLRDVWRGATEPPALWLLSDKDRCRGPDALRWGEIKKDAFEEIKMVFAEMLKIVDDAMRRRYCWRWDDKMRLKSHEKQVVDGQINLFKRKGKNDAFESNKGGIKNKKKMRHRRNGRKVKDTQIQSYGFEDTIKERPGPRSGKTPVFLAECTPGPGFFARKTGVLSTGVFPGEPGFSPIPR